MTDQGSDTQKQIIESWLETRPQTVKDIAHRFPPWTSLEIEGRRAYVVSYAEIVGMAPCIEASFTDPAVDYWHARSTHFLVCATCLAKLATETYVDDVTGSRISVVNPVSPGCACKPPEGEQPK